MKPLLTLCMMVKDEAHGIARTLQSAKPWIDRYRIFDTGSTDGTQVVIDDELRGVPGLLTDEPFVDFATTRNELLRTASYAGTTEFLLLLDADDVIEGGAALRAFLEAESERFAKQPKTCTCLNGPCDVGEAEDFGGCGYSMAEWDEWEARNAESEAFYVNMHQSGCEWTSARVVRAEAGWRYVGAVHEVLCKEGAPAPSITIPSVRILHDPPPRSVEASRARWARDAELLRPEAEKGSPRAAFYLAETLRRLGDEKGARYWYMQRNVLGGWIEEVFVSRWQFARLCEPCVWVTELLNAHATDPRRAEPLYDLARYYLDIAVAKRGADGASWSRQPEDALAFLFASRAVMLPKPQGALFVDAEVYAWKAADVLAQAAWWLGEWEIGERAARQAVENGPPDGASQRARNLGFYLERKAAR